MITDILTYMEFQAPFMEQQASQAGQNLMNGRSTNVIPATHLS